MNDKPQQSGERLQQTGDLAPAAPRRRRWWVVLLQHLLAIVLLAATFCSTFWLYWQNNDFPLSWHPDERGKVDQVLQERRNFNHPQLLLEATGLWTRYFQTPSDPFATVVAGRSVSAAFGAATVTLLAAAAYLAAGLPGLILGALAIGLCPHLLTYSHYMKEDASLAVGIAAVVFASRWVWNTRHWYSRLLPWLALGAACALAASGKYVGAGTVAMAVLLVLLAPAWRWWSIPFRLILVTLGLAAALLLINHRVLNPDGVDLQLLRQGDWESALNPHFLNSLRNETEHSLSDHRGLTADKPNTYVLATAARQCGWHILVLAGALPLLLLVGRRHGWGWEILFILFAAGFTFLVSFTVILFARYALPTVLLLHFLAALSAARMVQLLAGSRWLQLTVLVLLANVFVIMQLPMTIDYARQFASDSRDAAKTWLAANLPAGAVVYADEYAALDVESRHAGPLRYQRPDVRCYQSFSASEFGSLDSLGRRGDNTYVVISSLLYDRFLEPRNRPTDEYRDSYERAVPFYNELLHHRTPVWKSIQKYPQEAFTSPDIYVFRLGDTP